MKTFNLEEATLFLKLHPEEVRRGAKAGIIPGAKLGKRWAFIDDDLATYMRSLYPNPRQALQVGHRENTLCHSLNVEKRGGLASPYPVASVLDALLQQKTASRRENSTTS